MKAKKELTITLSKNEAHYFISRIFQILNTGKGL